jgi:SAM-dependent methyltransferase
MEIHEVVKLFVQELQIEPIYEQEGRHFQLWWSPPMDDGRKRHGQIWRVISQLYKDQRVLQIGYPWQGNEFPSAKVLDYTGEHDDADYKLNPQNMPCIKDGSFDLVLCNSILEQMPKFWLVAQEMCRVLDKNGVLWVTAPAVWPHHPDGESTEYGGDYWRFTHRGLAELFEEHCDKLATWYIPAQAPYDNPQSGWGVVYVGRKRDEQSKTIGLPGR